MEQKETLDIDDSSHELNVIKQKIRHNLEYLLSYVKDNNIQLLQKYSGNIDRGTTIISKCLTDKCENLSSKTFKQLLISGSYCELCTEKNKQEKRKTTCIERFGVRYNKLEYLQSYVKDNNIQLLQKYSGNINKGTTIISKCLTDKCKNSSSKTFGQLLKSGSYCELCTEKNKQEKMKTTNMERRGVEYPSQDTNVKEKKKATNMERRGVENPSQDTNVKEKKKATNMERRGVEYPSQDTNVKEKKKATNMERRGVEYSLQDPGVREKGKETSIERYGFEHPMKNSEVREKGKATNLKLRGVEYASQDPVFRDKCKATSMERYGFEHPMKNSEYSEKASHNAYKAYDYKLPSGKTIRIQGYEKFAIDDLLAQNINEDDIITKRTEVPECFYKDSEDKNHRYYVDVLIQSQKLCIEVKSTWTLYKNKEKVVFTKKALEDLGYKCEIWVYDGKGVRIEKIC